MAVQLNVFEGEWEKLDSPIARDLKLNFKKFATDSSLTEVEVGAIALAVGQVTQYDLMSKFGREVLLSKDLSKEQILEAEQSAAIMGMLNTYYKFRTFMKNAEDYSQAGLRMTGLARPQLGKPLFEMLALVVSIVNGCETCVVSHEKALRDHGIEASKIHDAIRLASTIKGLSSLSN